MQSKHNDISMPQTVRLYRPEGSLLPRVAFPSRLAGQDPGFTNIGVNKQQQGSAEIIERISGYSDGPPGVVVTHLSHWDESNISTLRQWQQIEPAIPKELVTFTRDVAMSVHNGTSLPQATEAADACRRLGFHLTIDSNKFEFLDAYYVRPSLHQQVGTIEVPGQQGVIHVPVLTSPYPLDACLKRKELGSYSRITGPTVFEDSGRIVAHSCLQALTELGALTPAHGNVKELERLMKKSALVEKCWFDCHQRFLEKFDRILFLGHAALPTIKLLHREFEDIATNLSRSTPLGQMRRIFPSYQYIDSRVSHADISFAPELHEFKKLHAETKKILSAPIFEALALGGLKCVALHEAQHQELRLPAAFSRGKEAEAICLLTALQSRGRLAEFTLAKLFRDASKGDEASQLAVAHLVGDLSILEKTQQNFLPLYASIVTDLNQLALSAKEAMAALAAELKLNKENLIELS